MSLVRRFAAWLVTTVVGLLVWVGWQCVRGDGSSDHQALDHVPEKVWDGGTMIALNVRLGTQSHLQIHFRDKNGKKEVDVERTLPAGNHQFTIDVPEGTRVSIECSMMESDAAAEIECAVMGGDRKLAEKKVTGEPYGLTLDLNVP